jgi:hypothetical protein
MEVAFEVIVLEAVRQLHAGARRPTTRHLGHPLRVRLAARAGKRWRGAAGEPAGQGRRRPTAALLGDAHGRHPDKF